MPNRFLSHGILVAVMIAVFLQLSTAARANNNYFLPGDSFFHTVLTESMLQEIEKSKSPVFRYVRPDHLDTFLCGFAGFDKLQVKDMSPAIKKNLQGLYRDLREDYPLQIELVEEIRRVPGDAIGDGDKEIKTGKILRRELNGFSMFFYNAGFDANRYRIALRYNETWVEDVVSFGHQREHIQFEFFIREEKAILSDWRDASLVKPLDVIGPAIEVRRSRDALPPVTLTSKMRVFILPKTNFQAAYDRNSDTFFHGIYEVTETGIQFYSARGNSWRARPYEIGE
ncbi:MAG: hypothetical protein VX738_06620 [Planctomycetota bacterium]|nr:hypothetical protein [Planctomycetota bacterium]